MWCRRLLATHAIAIGQETGITDLLLTLRFPVVGLYLDTEVEKRRLRLHLTMSSILILHNYLWDSYIDYLLAKRIIRELSSLLSLARKTRGASIFRLLVLLEGTQD